MIKDIIALLEQIPVWKELIALPKKVQELELKIKELESKLEKPKKKGVECPYCNETDTQVTDIKPHQFMAEVMETRHFKCNECEKTFTKDYERM